MLKKIREFLSQKGQGVVEYTLLLGVVTVIAVGVFDGSNLKASIQNAVNIMKEFLLNAEL